MTKEDILHHFQDINFYYNDCGMYDDLSRMLDELISENKGEWIPVYGKNGKTIMSYKCSKCDFHPKHAIITDFCGGCGADMRGE